MAYSGRAGTGGTVVSERGQAVRRDFYAQKRKTAADRDIEGATMRGREMRRIRKEAGLSLYELASLLRYQDFDGLRRIEERDQLLSGPMQVAVEAIRDGRINPDEELA